MPIEYQIGLMIAIPSVIIIIMIISRLVLFYQIKQRFQNAVYTYGEKSAILYESEVYQRLKTYHQYFKSLHDVDDITWNDLNMDEVFRQLNITQTSIGDEFLYHRLHQQNLSDEDLLNFEKWIQAMDDSSTRHSTQRKIAIMDKAYMSSLSEFLSLPDSFQIINTKRILINLFLLLGSLSISLINFYGFLSLLIAVICYNIVSYERLFKNYFKESQSCSYFLEMLEVLHEIEKKPISGFEDEYLQLKENLKPFDKFRRTSILYFRSKDEKDILTRLVKCATYIDFFTYNHFRKTISLHQESAIFLYNWLGKVESAIAVSSYRKSMKNFSVPVFSKQDHIIFEEASHVLIENAVGNSGTFEQGILISGSNASGKSTFIKTMAINMILSQSIHTASAKSFLFRRSLIYTSMAINDNLETNESYYIVEIKSLKRILDASQYQLPIICFVDEILRGTNTIERISASSSILKKMSTIGIFAFVATHDIELTEILKEYYDNYHFSEQISDQKMSFDFILKHGFTTTKNAIALLNLYQYDQDITSSAQKMAEHFEKDRSWEIIPKETLK